MTAGVGVAAALGASGVLLALSAVLGRRQALWRQLSPYVGAVEPADALTRATSRVVGRVLSRRVGWAWGTDRHLGRLCAALGSDRTVTQVRITQVAHAAMGVALAVAWVLLRSMTHPGSSPVLSLAVIAVAPVAAGWWTRSRLETAVRNRAQAMDMQLPTVLELLAFAISAGESMVAALERVSHTVDGALAAQLRTAVRDIGTGQSVAAALRSVAQSTTSPAVARAAHAIDVALERGTPLAEVLRSQASDARAHLMRQMLVLAGKKETAMMIPVVFLVLPTIVAVAIYPGFVQLRMW